MDSLDEFQVLESMIQKSEETLKQNRKKPRTDLNDSITNNNNDDNNNNYNNQMEFLQNIISSEFSNYQELSHRNELIKKLCQRLFTALQNNEEIKKSEMAIAQELQDMKYEMQQFSTFVNNYKGQIKNSNNINYNNGEEFDEDESSLELCRKQILSQSSFLSQIDYNHIDTMNNDCDKSLKRFNAVHSNYNNSNPNVQMLIDQIKTLEEKIQTERKSYLEENERLIAVIDEKQKLIDDLESKQISQIKPSCDNNSLQGYNFQTNNRLLVVLSDLVKTFLDTENEIQKQLESLGLERSKSSPNKNDDLLAFPSLEDERLLSSNEINTFDLCEDGPDLTTPSSIIYTTTNPLSTSGSTTIGVNNNNDMEDDVVLGASRRLRFAVERVLKILSDTLEHQKHDFKEILKQKEDLRLEFQEECQRSDKLTRQLMDKEELIKKLENEQKILSEKIIDYNEITAQQERLKQKLDEFEREREKFLNDNKKLEMERKLFDQGLPQLHQKLLHENEVLSRDIRLLQQEKKNLITKINNLTSEVESLKTDNDQIIESKNAEFEELLSQLDSKEKNLNSLKRFIEEQTQERELEREEFMKELNMLKDKIKEKEKFENKLKSNIRVLENQITLLNEDKVQKDEQIEELNKNLKDTNAKLIEFNLIKRQLESEIEQNSRIEKALQSRLKELSNVLQVKLNDETNWDEVINAIDQFVVSKSQSHLPTSPNKNIGYRKLNIKQSNNLKNHESQDLDNSIFTTIKLMDDNIQELNVNIESLQSKNENLKAELKDKNEMIIKLEPFKSKVESLEKNLKELTKTNDLLQQEINASHMKYSELKVKLDSSVDVNEFKRVVNDLQNKLSNEKKQTEQGFLKLEQANRHANELTEKLDAYKKEIKSFKELFKSHDQEKNGKDNLQDRRNSKDVVHEINKMNNKLEIKDRTISLLEHNIEILKSKLDSVTNERDTYSERLKSVDDSKSKITIYEKNLEKLRLQNKISSDKITYLELEIQNLRKKIDLLEKENEMLKIENQQMIKQKQEINSAMLTDYVDEQTDLANPLNVNGNKIYLNGFDKMNNISSNNLLMLKVRRLLTQKGALIYQKNYLIHVLGSYQRTENDTLALLANFNNSKDAEDDDVKMRGKSKFRSIVYGLIALNRMKFMVNIWQCRKRQLLFHKTANSIASLQNVPLPPRKMSKENKNNNQQAQSHMTSIHHLHHLKHPLTSQINSTLKDYVDRLHVVHETLGLHTNKRL